MLFPINVIDKLTVQKSNILELLWLKFLTTYCFNLYRYLNHFALWTMFMTLLT